MKTTTLMKNKSLLANTKFLATVVFVFAFFISNAQTTTFNYTGGMQTYTVPPGVTSLAIDAYGAQGGGTGGLGGRVQCTMAVTPGDVLNIFVGGQGGPQVSNSAGGYNGGGTAGTCSVNYPGAGGGGASDIRLNSTLLANRVVVAGGGGGSHAINSTTNAGVGGGLTGGSITSNGNTCVSFWATGGSQVAGGNTSTGTASCCSFTPVAANNGSLGQGGNGAGPTPNCNSGDGGAGGGGGYYGGGAGGVYTAGGGGSSYTSGICTAVTHTQGVRSGNGQIIITVLTTIGAALNFDGVDDQVNCGTVMNTTLDNAPQLTVEAWVYPTSTAGFGCIVGNYWTSVSGMQFLLRRDGSAYTFWVDLGSGLNSVSTGNVVALSTWQHVVGVWNGAQLMIYLNGVLQNTNGAVVGTSLGSTTNPVMIGWNNFGEKFTGSIDEVRIWTRALCGGEILNYNSCEIPTTGSGLIANYHFNQGVANNPNPSVTTLNDASGSGYNGTLTNFALTGLTSNWVAPGGVVSGTSCGAFIGPTITASASPATICSGSSSTLTGGGGVAYLWNPGSISGSPISVSPLTTTTYTVIGTNASGCTGTATVTVTVSPNPTANSSATPIACNGGNATVTVVGSGGTSPYTGEGTFTVTAGPYSYTVTDANGCTAITNITVTEPTLLTASSSATSIACNGGNATVTVVGSGGTSPYTGDGTFTVPAGSYSYTVTDANGCTAITNITITEPTLLTASSSATSIACNGGTANVTVVGAGGTSPYTGEGTFTTTAGTYSYTVTDANGCTAITNITITEPTAISASVVTVDVSCFGGSNGSIDLTVTGGTSPYTFDWNSGTYTTEDLSGLPAGSYVGVLTDANGCTNGGTVVITEPPVLVATILTVTNPSTCGGTDGAIDIQITGGTPGYTFLWNTTATTEDITGIGAGAYNCTVTDSLGCTTSVNTDLSDPSAPIVTLALAVDTVCNTDGSYLLSGGSPAGGTYSGPAVSSGSFNPSIANAGMNYISYTYTDINGCTGSTSDSIFVDPCAGVMSTSIGENYFTVMPNPNNGTFMLQLNTTGVADVMIYDALGQLVIKQKVQPRTPQQLNIEQSGVYLIAVVTADGNRTTKRVIVNK